MERLHTVHLIIWIMEFMDINMVTQYWLVNEYLYSILFIDLVWHFVMHWFQAWTYCYIIFAFLSFLLQCYLLPHGLVDVIKMISLSVDLHINYVKIKKIKYLVLFLWKIMNDQTEMLKFLIICMLKLAVINWSNSLQFLQLLKISF